MSNKTSRLHLTDATVDLNDLRVFACVASFASFSLAADALKIHKSSVSRSVLRLEMVLETSLFERTTRKVVLTRRGKTLKHHTIQILSRVEETLEKIKSMNEASTYGVSSSLEKAGSKRATVETALLGGIGHDLAAACSHGSMPALRLSAQAGGIIEAKL
jgi:hypothetical protein